MECLPMNKKTMRIWDSMVIKEDMKIFQVSKISQTFGVLEINQKVLKIFLAIMRISSTLVQNLKEIEPLEEKI